MFNTSDNYSMSDYLCFDGLSDYDIMINAIDKEDEDISDEKPTVKHIGKRKTGRAYRRSSGKRKNKKMKTIAAGIGKYDCPPMWLNWRRIDGEWVQVGNYLKYPNRSSRQKYLKHCSNKKVRKSVDICGKGNAYRREFDYKWELY